MLRRMLLTYKQNRFEVIGTVLVTAVIAAATLYVAWELRSIVFPAGCSPIGSYTPVFDASGQQIFTEPSRACQSAIDRFTAIQNGLLAQVAGMGLVLVPFPIAILLGAPLVAREIEQNTAPLSWSLVGSRRRWLLVRIVSILIVLVPAMLILGLAGDVLYAARNPGVSPWASFGDYGLRGVVIVFWTLAAFMGTMALGTLFGRTVPAIFVALVVCLFVRVAGEYYFQRVVLEPYSQPLMTVAQMETGYYAWDPTDMTVSWRYYLDGKPFEGDVNEWYATNTFPPEMIQPVPTINPDPNATAGANPTPDPNTTIAPIVWGPQSLPYGFHGDMYWPVVVTESAILLGGSVFLASIAFFWVGRRRPY